MVYFQFGESKMRTIRSLLLMVVWVAVCTSANPASTPSPSALACPEACQCATTPEGLHKATCSDLPSLHKYSVRNKHHNINVIDLSDAHIGKVHGELDKFTEVVSIDLSSNSMAHLNKLLRKSNKLVHLNLAKNLLKNFDASHIPSSVSSLDLRHNMLHNAPTNLHSLRDLEHLQLNGNPLRCTCNSLKELDVLRKQGVVIDDVKCISPMNVKGLSWAELKISDICIEKKNSADHKNILLEDMMMGDQPLDTENIAPDTTNLKSMPLTVPNDLEVGEVWEGSGGDENDDDKVFLGITTENSKVAIVDDVVFEGSGESIIEPRSGYDLSEKMVLDSNISTTEEPGSGDFGSGLVIGSRGLFGKESSSTVDSLYDSYDDEGSGDDTLNTSSTTSEPFITGLFNPFFMSSSDSNSSTSEEPFELPESPKIFKGSVDWDAVQPEPSSEKPDTEPVVEEEIIKVVSYSDESGQKMAVNGPSEDLKEAASKEPVKSSVGTYICIGILIVLLVGLIGVTIIRGQSRKRRDRNLIRQQKKDVEKADKEMVDMNKSLLGKPVVNPNEAEKKSNGNNYELVPTHDPRKTSKNGTFDSTKGVDENIQRSEAPEPVAQSLSSFKPSGAPAEPISIPKVEEPTGPYDPYHSSVDAPLTNGGTYNNPNMNLLPPPNEYIPVYDSGRVRIKLTETPKPKTPVLVTRSRSNAGEIIITPSPEQISPSKSTT